MSFLKLCSVLSGSVSNFSCKPAQPKLLLLRSNVCLACRLELKWSQDKSIRKVFTCFVCVLMMWSDWGWSLGEGANFYFSWGTKNWVFWHYQLEKAVWYKLFVNLVYTLTLPIHPSTLLGDLWFKVVLSSRIHAAHYAYTKYPLCSRSHLLCSFQSKIHFRTIYRNYNGCLAWPIKYLIVSCILQLTFRTHSSAQPS